MKQVTVVAISDTHSRHDGLVLPYGDILVHAGDFSNEGGEAEVVDFLSWFSDQPHEHKVMIAGNHDKICERDPERFHQLRVNLWDNVTYLDGELCELDINGRKITIYGEPRTPAFGRGWAFNVDRRFAYTNVWSKVPDVDIDILLTHGPPNGVLDVVQRFGRDAEYYDEHVGCTGMRKFLNKRRGRVGAVVCGHIHEGYGQGVAAGGTRVFNVSIMNWVYKPVNQPTVFEI